MKNSFSQPGKGRIQKEDKELSQETLMIGGLVKRPTTSMLRKAASKEYHNRHTRHIRG